MAITGARRQAVGQWGEQRAAQYLTGLGWTVLERNWRCAAGEVDLVARDPGGALVLVEVKTRSGRGYGAPLEAITRAKADRLRDLVVHYRRSHDLVGPMRVDAVGVLRGRDGVSITHVEGILA